MVALSESEQGCRGERTRVSLLSSGRPCLKAPHHKHLAMFHHNIPNNDVPRLHLDRLNFKGARWNSNAADKTPKVLWTTPGFVNGRPDSSGFWNPWTGSRCFGVDRRLVGHPTTPDVRGDFFRLGSGFFILSSAMGRAASGPSNWGAAMRTPGIRGTDYFFWACHVCVGWRGLPCEIASLL
jgi:hypothetical protein